MVGPASGAGWLAAAGPGQVAGGLEEPEHAPAKQTNIKLPLSEYFMLVPPLMWMFRYDG